MTKRTAVLPAAVAFVTLISGCSGYERTRSVLANPEDATIVQWVRGAPVCETNSPEDIAASGFVRVVVSRAIVPVRHFEVARYRTEHIRFYAGPSFCARLLLLPVYIVVIVPVDILASGTHGGPFPIAHEIFKFDEEWEPLPGIEERADVTDTDLCDHSRREPSSGENCDLIVGEGARPRYVSDDKRVLRILTARSGEGGVCEFDLRPLARESWQRHESWHFRLRVLPGGYGDESAPLTLSEEKVFEIAGLK